jgi:UDP-perosamine 4-acetyltransferase
VLDIVRAGGRFRPIGFIDADPTLVGKQIGGVPVLGAMNLLPKLLKQVRHAVVAIGDNRVRRSCAQRLAAAGVELVNVIHPAAWVSPTAILGRNIVIAAGVIVSTGARLADSVLLNTGALIDHECEVGEGAHIGPGARLAGRVQIGAGVFVGMGANVVQCLRIGTEATVGAGAVVLRDVEDGTTVAGVPARLLHPRPMAAA